MADADARNRRVPQVWNRNYPQEYDRRYRGRAYRRLEIMQILYCALRDGGYYTH